MERRKSKAYERRFSPIALSRFQWVDLAVSVKYRLHYSSRHIRIFYCRFGAYARAHPGLFTIHICGSVAVLTSIILLPALGFGTLGPVAGSVAAAWQTFLGNIAAGSLFAFLQSAGMGGAAASVFAGIGIAGAGALVGIAPIASRMDEIGERVGDATRKIGETIGDAWRKIGESFMYCREKME